VNEQDARRRPPARPRPKGGTAASQPQRTGTPSSGTIVRLMFGQGHGYIRLADRREVYFHRGDVAEGTPFNEFAVGDKLSFELLEDKFSGPRALAVRRAG
jgi:cold shock CspA family protein